MASKKASPVEMKEMKNGEPVEEEDGQVVDEYVAVPPDGGYGWVVMVAAFLCNVVVDGIIFSIGPVVAAMTDSFGVSAFDASWVASLLAGFYLLAGIHAINISSINNIIISYINI